MQKLDLKLAWSLVTFLLRLTTAFPRPLMFAQAGEQAARPLSMFLSALFWGALIQLAFWKQAWLKAADKAGGNPEFDRATLALFWLLCLFACLHTILDWIRRDLTKGTYILSKFIGQPRLPVGLFWGSAFFWLVPAAICRAFHGQVSEALFLWAGLCFLIEHAMIWHRQRMELLNHRDGHLLNEALAGREKEIIGLQGTMRMAGVTGVGALQSKYDDL